MESIRRVQTNSYFKLLNGNKEWKERSIHDKTPRKSSRTWTRNWTEELQNGEVGNVNQAVDDCWGLMIRTFLCSPCFLGFHFLSFSFTARFTPISVSSLPRFWFSHFCPFPWKFDILNLCFLAFSSFWIWTLLNICFFIVNLLRGLIGNIIAILIFFFFASCYVEVLGLSYLTWTTKWVFG